ncbi:hypothetical protein ABTX99_29875 [Streptomyces flaveolus]|uniref:hypothetical protein n=1 Tax=Streptomyces flaveolus TaxID=67297 RepID=UPI003316E438
MAVAELILKYVEALVWPLVTVGLVWILRGHIRAAFARMTRLETPAGAIEFASDARDTRNEAEELAASSGAEVPTGPTTEDEPSRFGVFQEAWDTADVSPIGALMTAWLLLESMTKRALDERNALPPPRRPGAVLSPIDIIDALARLGLSQRAISVFQDLRQLRNRATHGLEQVTPAAARDFVESARYVALQVYALPRP